MMRGGSLLFLIANIVVGPVDFVGERHVSGGRRWATRERCPRSVPTTRRARAGPKDSSTHPQEGPVRA